MKNSKVTKNKKWLQLVKQIEKCYSIGKKNEKCFQKPNK